MKLKLAIICPIFSKSFSGGAEKHIFDLANLFVNDFEIEVFTTDSTNYRTWKSENIQEINPYKVHRFKVLEQRNLNQFNKIHDKILSKKNISDKEMSEWIISQGPYVPNLIQNILEQESKFDLFLFMSYLYYPTIYGIKKLEKKSILIPTFHDEEAIYFPIFKKIFTNSISYAFNTMEEFFLFKKVFQFSPSHFSIIGPVLKEIEFSNPKPLPYPFVLYIGRIDLGKGLSELIKNFLEYKKKFPSKLKLILLGKGEIDFKHEDLIFTGFVTEQEKNNYLFHSELLLNPSKLESFSISVMEAWLMEKTVLVNANSEVLKAHCLRSNAGLYYSSNESFILLLNFLLNEKEKAKEMGKNGKKYVLENYNEKIILEKFKKLFFLTHQKNSKDHKTSSN